MAVTQNQLLAISITERVCSAVSLAATSIIIISFLYSNSFRKPINRLVFFASWGNIMANIATFVSQSGIHEGLQSPICQFQAFLIQWFMPADALWTLAMACNVYLTFFHKYDSEQLRRLEWKYLVLCYGIPFIPGFAYFFIESQTRGKVYGSAILWCWIAPEWDYLRIGTFYGPVWFVIFLTFAIYARAGSVIYRKRRELREVGEFNSFLHPNHRRDSFILSRVTEVQITSEVTSTTGAGNCSPAAGESIQPLSAARSVSYNPYTVLIEGGSFTSKERDLGVPKEPLEPVVREGNSLRQEEEANNYNSCRRPAASESNSNSTGWIYSKYAILFFIALLVTWVPSTINRIYGIVYPNDFNFPLNYIASFVLPLQGFWNSIIYVSISWRAFKQAFEEWKGDLPCKSLTTHAAGARGNSLKPRHSRRTDSTGRLVD